jgi:hypothetical protein
MSDLVAELRTWEAAPNVRSEVRSLAKKAADEIERLTAELAEEERTVYACIERLKRPEPPSNDDGTQPARTQVVA